MKKIIFFTTIGVLILISCKKDITPSSEDQTLAQIQSITKANISQGALPFRDTFIVNWDGQQVINPCTNELTTVYGSELVTIHGVNDSVRSKFTVNVHFLQGFRAIGESGRQYVIQEALLFQESHFADGVVTIKLVANLRWLTKGGGNNFINSETSYIKIDAYGNVTVIREPIKESYCQ